MPPSKKTPKPTKSTKSKKPSKAVKKQAAEAKQKIWERLSKTSESLPGSAVRVHEYADGSVDGELSIPVPRGTPTRALFLDVEEALGKKAFGPGYWISAGERFVIREDEEVYRRYKGMNDVSVYYQRATPSKVAEVLLIARDTVTGGMERKYRRKSDTIYVRIHWNATDAKPKR